MRIDLISLCDAALEVNGRLHILGSIDSFWAATVPYTHPQCALAVRLRWENYEAVKKHKMRVQIVDADGNCIAEDWQRKLAPPAHPHEDMPLIRNVIVSLEQLKFEDYGPYAVRVDLNGIESAILPFCLIPPCKVAHSQT